MDARVPTGISESNHPVSLQSQLERTQVGYRTVSAVLRKMKKWSSDNEVYYLYRAAEARLQTAETDRRTSRESGLN